MSHIGMFFDSAFGPRTRASLAIAAIVAALAVSNIAHAETLDSARTATSATLAAPVTPAAAQVQAAPRSPAAAQPAQADLRQGRLRRLAPGVETTIPPDRQETETFSTHDVVELVQGVADLQWTPELSPVTQTLYELARGRVFRRDIWCLEFTFKPVRMLYVDIPQPSGRMQRKLIWYMVYHVKNTGNHLRPTLQKDATYKSQPFDRDVRFFPHFVLESPEYKKAYLDRTIPVAIAAIRMKEDPNRPLLNSIEMAAKPIPVAKGRVDKGVWGVATWEEVDPRVDFFSIYIQGLTNAYKWIDPPGAFKPGNPPGTGRVLLSKTLVLNFWRPGDVHLEDQRVIQYGIPGKVDYAWVYR